LKIHIQQTTEEKM